jgi:hypothetical protein
MSPPLKNWLEKAYKNPSEIHQFTNLQIDRCDIFGEEQNFFTYFSALGG